MHFIQNVEEWGKLILSVDGVHIVIDSDIADAFAGESRFPRSREGACDAANPSTACWNTGIFPKLIDFDTDLFSGYGGKGHNSKKPAYRDVAAVRPDERTPEHRAEAKQDLQLLNAQKIGEHEAEIRKNQKCVPGYPAGH